MLPVILVSLALQISCEKLKSSASHAWALDQILSTFGTYQEEKEIGKDVVIRYIQPECSIVFRRKPGSSAYSWFGPYVEINGNQVPNDKRVLPRPKQTEQAGKNVIEWAASDAKVLSETWVETSPGRTVYAPVQQPQATCMPGGNIPCPPPKPPIIVAVPKPGQGQWVYRLELKDASQTLLLDIAAKNGGKINLTINGGVRLGTDNKKHVYLRDDAGRVIEIEGLRKEIK
jgi:hypothetical protein